MRAVRRIAVLVAAVYLPATAAQVCADYSSDEAGEYWYVFKVLRTCERLRRLHCRALNLHCLAHHLAIAALLTMQDGGCQVHTLCTAWRLRLLPFDSRVP